jgi:NAD(P)H-nitrite reductase large subunit
MEGIENRLFITNQKLTEIRPGEITVEDMRDGHSWRLIADTVVLSMGVRPRKDVAEQFADTAFDVIYAGDCAAKNGNITSAVRDGFYAAMNL